MPQRRARSTGSRASARSQASAGVTIQSPRFRNRGGAVLSTPRIVQALALTGSTAMTMPMPTRADAPSAAEALVRAYFADLDRTQGAVATLERFCAEDI